MIMMAIIMMTMIIIENSHNDWYVGDDNNVSYHETYYDNLM